MKNSIRNNQAFLFLLTIAIIILIHFFAGVFYSQLLMNFIFYLLVGKLLFYLFPHFVKYMLIGKNSAYKQSIENPRILIYLIFGIVAYSSYKGYILNSVSNEIIDTILSLFFITVFSISVTLLALTWTYFFEEIYINRIQKKILFKEDKQFQCNYSSEELSKIYDATSDNDFIILLSDDDSVEEKNCFISIFLSGKVPEDPIFKLKMSHRQTKLYFDNLRNKIVGFSLDDFIKIFENNNGRCTRDVIEASYSNSKRLPRKGKLIISIFSFLN